MKSGKTAPTTRISNEAVQAKTSKTWPEWFAVLDTAGAAKMSHQEIVAYLNQRHAVPEWWQQMVTVTYEQARGLRERRQTPRGYQVSASRTIAVPVATLFHAWRDEAARGRWLPDPAFAVRKATPNRSLYLTWMDGKTDVEVNFSAQGDAKSQVTVQHTKLASSEEVSTARAYWTKALDQLKQTLVG